MLTEEGRISDHTAEVIRQATDSAAYLYGAGGIVTIRADVLRHLLDHVEDLEAALEGMKSGNDEKRGEIMGRIHSAIRATKDEKAVLEKSNCECVDCDLLERLCDDVDSLLDDL